MPPKKKTQKANGFMMFMIEMRPRLESDGHKFPGGLMDVYLVCTPLWNNLTTEQKAVYTQRAAPVMKEDDEDEEEAIGSVPRLPNTFSKVVMKSIVPRVAANFGKPQSVLPGAGRGILAIGSVPRLPNTFSKVVMKSIGPRVAANFGKPKSVLPGAGRGILAYNIADMCCEHYDLSLLPNRHVPASIDNKHRYIVMPKANKVQDAQTPVMKEDDEDEEEAIGSVPRLPNTFSKVVMKSIVPRVAANFGKPQSVLPGAGRGILAIGSVPRLPNTFSKVVMKSVGPRVAANFGKPQSVLPGAGRGILAGASPMKLVLEPLTPGSPSQESAPSTLAGRGHGRGSLLSEV